MFRFILLVALWLVVLDRTNISVGSAGNDEQGECLDGGKKCLDRNELEKTDAVVPIIAGTNDTLIPEGSLPQNQLPKKPKPKPQKPSQGKPKPNKPGKPKPSKPGKPKPQKPGGKPQRPKPKPQRPKPQKPKPKPQKPKPQKPKPQNQKPQRPRPQYPVEENCAPMGYSCNCDCCRGYCAETNFGSARYCIKLDGGDSVPPICKKTPTGAKPQKPPAATNPNSGSGGGAPNPVAGLPVVGGSSGGSGGGSPSGAESIPVVGGSTGGAGSNSGGVSSGSNSGSPGGASSGQGQGVENIPVVGSGLQQGASGATAKP